MAKGECISCKAIINISDDIVECEACGAVMSVAGWNPFQLELVESETIYDEKVEPVIEQVWNKYSTGGRRFVAGFVDGIVLLPIGLIDNWALNSSPPLIAIWLIISYSAGWVYIVLMHGHYGQTIGKMVCGIKVLDISEHPITMRQAFLRESVIISINIVSLVITLYIVLAGDGINSLAFAHMQWVISVAALLWFAAEILTLLTNEKRRALHDFIAGTVVVRVSNQSPNQNGA